MTFRNPRSKAGLGRLQRALTSWYLENARALPWRRTRDPYRIWVSEIMLQQTRVEGVLSYYDRFIETFPSLEALAAAPLEKVLRAWQGMGYYGRARNLHRAARLVRDRFQGRIPSDPAQLRGLPGIGPYTAAAIASIAFDKDVAVLDGNVGRVLCRLYAVEGELARPSTRKSLQALADRLLPRGDAATFNQALMELGATICRPRRPDCEACPAHGCCLAHHRGEVSRLPRRTTRKRPPRRRRVVGVIAFRGRLLLELRPPQGLLGGLWELPGLYLDDREGEEAGLGRLLARLDPEGALGVRCLPPDRRVRVEQVYTHFHESITAFRCKAVRGTPPRTVHRRRGRPPRWVHPNHLGRYPLTGAARKVLEKMGRVPTGAGTPRPSP